MYVHHLNKPTAFTLYSTRRHECAIVHLNTCCFFSLSFNHWLSHSVYWKATLIASLKRKDIPSQLIPGGVLQRQHFQWLQCIKAFTFCFLGQKQAELFLSTRERENALSCEDTDYLEICHQLFKQWHTVLPPPLVTGQPLKAGKCRGTPCPVRKSQHGPV